MTTASQRSSLSRGSWVVSFLLLPLFFLLAGGCGSTGSSGGGSGSSATPTVTISASPTSLTAGNAATLTVAAAHATSVTISGSDKSSYTLAATGGSQKVTPAATTTYTTTATGAGGTVTATATVTVTDKAPTVTITASPTTMGQGGTSTLTVTATNATTVTVTGSDKSSYTLAATGGTQKVTPTATTTYTATATGAGGTVTATAAVTVLSVPEPTVTITASPTSITEGSTSTIKVVATYAVSATLSGSDGSTYTLSATGGTQVVSPSTTTTYTAEATGSGGTGTVSDTATVTVAPASSVKAIQHVIFMMQENHTFDNYFGMLNVYRHNNNMDIGDDGQEYDVDGIDDKLNISNKNDEGVSIPLFKMKSSCIDDASSAWLESYGDINRYNFLNSRPIKNDGFVHTAEGFANACLASGSCSGDYTDTAGQRAMGYYDDTFLNYYYYMASEFAVSDRWFSPIASKSNPNRIATLTGGTTQGLAFDPGYDDHVGSRNMPSIFQVLDNAGVSWKVYYTDTAGECSATDDDCASGASSYPATTLGYINYAKKYLYPNPSHAACTAPTQPSSVVGDTTNYFCVDPSHIATLATYFTDLTNGTLPSVAFIEPGYGVNDEHPGSFQPVLLGQAQMAKIINALMASPEWSSSVFFFSYDEGGGPYDHVPPVPNHSNDNTDAALGTIPDISSIAVNPDVYNPCLPPTGTLATAHCDLRASSPGAHSGDAAAVHGFAAQIGFRVPNIVISPFTRRHYVSHIPMDHTAVIRFIEDRFIGNGQYLTARDAAQPNLLDFFDFVNVPWATPPTPPVPASNASLGRNTCTPANLGP